MREELKKARKEMGLSQEEAANLIQCATGYYNEIENGVKDCSLSVQERIEKAFGVRIQSIRPKEAPTS